MSFIQNNYFDYFRQLGISDFRIDIMFIPDDEHKWERICDTLKYYFCKLIICDTIETANKYKQLFKKYHELMLSDTKYHHKNFKVDIITPETSYDEEQKIIKEFGENELDIIITVGFANEGLEIPCAESCVFIEDDKIPYNTVQSLQAIQIPHPGKLYGKMLLFEHDTNFKGVDVKYKKYIYPIQRAFRLPKNMLTERIRIATDYERDKYLNYIHEYERKLFDKIK